MKKSYLAIAVVAAILLTAASADAAPIQPMHQETTDIVQVRGFCGLGRHRGPWGGCLPNGYGYGPYYAYAAPYYRCWWRPGPAGPVRVCGW
ncbi:MAG: hypothetical protein K2X60_06040 [Xanthobacteraceae bacterium]|nr:hypothetical protein [Xanthobacteraceae bacterium]